MNAAEKLHERDLAQRLSEAEATIEALLSDQIDAVVDSRSHSPVLLSKAQEALRESEERYRRIVETAAEGISVVNAESTLTFVNRRFAEMLGYRPEEMIGTSLFAIVPEAGKAAAALRVERSRQGIAEEHEVEYLRKDGSELWTLLKTNPVRNADGAWAGTLDMTTDWTRHRQDEEALRTSMAQLGESEARFRQLAEASREIFYLRDPQTTQMFYVSPAYRGDLRPQLRKPVRQSQILGRRHTCGRPGAHPQGGQARRDTSAVRCRVPDRAARRRGAIPAFASLSHL